MDECETDSHGCQHTCVNLFGSYKCHCDPGYELKKDGKGCLGQWSNHNHEWYDNYMNLYILETPNMPLYIQEIKFI